MAAESIHLLTERERDCLRAVSSGSRIKNVGAAVGIAQETARQHLSSARGKLGVGSSEEAAQLLAQHEARDTPLSGGSPTRGMEPATDWRSEGPSIAEERQPSFETVREEQIAFRVIKQPAPPRFWLLFLQMLGEGNDLSAGQRLSRIAAQIALLAFALGTLTSGLSALSQLLVRLRQ